MQRENSAAFENTAADGMYSMERRLKIMTGAVIAGEVALLSYAGGPSKFDDAYIYARYIANSLAGRGMVFNAGEHVNALTSPLYGYLLLLTSWLLHGKILLATVVLSAAFLFLTSLLAERLVPFSGLFIASTAYFYFLVGMETSLFLFVILAVVTAFLKARYNWLPFLCALLVLSRFEGGLLILVVAWQLYRKRAWPTPKALLPGLVTIVCFFLLNHHFYGSWLPSSTTAKLGQGFSGYWGPWPTAFLMHFDLVTLPFQKTKYVLYLVAVFLASGITQMGRSTFSILVFPFCASLLAFYVLLNLSGLYFWYFAPFILFAIIYASRAIPNTPTAKVTACIVLAAAVFTNAAYLRNPWPMGRDRYAGYVEAGKWIAQNTPADARIELPEIGLLGWYSHRKIIDVIGLATPKNALHVAHHDIVSWLDEDKPDYVLVHEPNWNWEKVAGDSPDYVRLPITFTGNLALLERKDYMAMSTTSSTH